MLAAINCSKRKLLVGNAALESEAEADNAEVENCCCGDRRMYRVGRDLNATVDC